MAKHKHHRETGRGTGLQRQLRVGELVRHAIAEMLTRGDVHDPVIEGHLITIPEVRMSPDLKLATVYVMPMGGRDADEVVAAFDKHKKFLRALLWMRAEEGPNSNSAGATNATCTAGSCSTSQSA
jgi:ribosome-binding factor A